MGKTCSETYEKLADMFWSDYMAKWDGLAENWDQKTILVDFLMWMNSRRADGDLPDLRIVRNRYCQTMVNYIMGSKSNVKTQRDSPAVHPDAGRYHPPPRGEIFYRLVRTFNTKEGGDYDEMY